MNIYSVLPFNGAKYHENEKKLKEGEAPCAICGKAVSKPYKYSAVVVHGGDWARTEEEANNQDDPGYMGVWGIGSDCHKKYLVR